MRRLVIIPLFVSLLSTLSSIAAAQAAPILPPAAPPAAASQWSTAPPLAAPPPPDWFAYRANELARIDARIAQLYEQRREFGIAGPIVMMGVGGGVIVIGGFAAIVASLASDVDHMGLYAFLPPAAVGLTLLIAGSALLADRAPPRRVLGREIQALRQHRRTFEWSVAPGPMSSRGASLALHANF